MKRTMLALAAAILVAVGCDMKPRPGAGDATKSGPASETAAVAIKPVTQAELVQEIERHKGKVVLLNFWAFF